MVRPLTDIVILRHGEAEDYAGSDAQRQLTAKGITDTNLQMQRLVEQGFKPDVIMHSPFVRTTQTAEICQQHFPDATLSAKSGLMHSAQPEQVPMLWQNYDSILLVSHMPLVARLLLYLIPSSDIFGFAVSGYVHIEVNSETLDSEMIHDSSRGCHVAL